MSELSKRKGTGSFVSNVWQRLHWTPVCIHYWAQEYNRTAWQSVHCDEELLSTGECWRQNAFSDVTRKRQQVVERGRATRREFREEVLQGTCNSIPLSRVPTCLQCEVNLSYPLPHRMPDTHTHKHTHSYTLTLRLTLNHAQNNPWECRTLDCQAKKGIVCRW